MPGADAPAPKAPAQHSDSDDGCGGVGETGVRRTSGPVAGAQGKAAHKLIRLDGQAGGACVGGPAAGGVGGVGETRKTGDQGAGRTGH